MVSACCFWYHALTSLHRFGGASACVVYCRARLAVPPPPNQMCTHAIVVASKRCKPDFSRLIFVPLSNCANRSSWWIIRWMRSDTSSRTACTSRASTAIERIRGSCPPSRRSRPWRRCRTYETELSGKCNCTHTSPFSRGGLRKRSVSRLSSPLHLVPGPVCSVPRGFRMDAGDRNLLWRAQQYTARCKSTPPRPLTLFPCNQGVMVCSRRHHVIDRLPPLFYSSCFSPFVEQFCHRPSFMLHISTKCST